MVLRATIGDFLIMEVSPKRVDHARLAETRLHLFSVTGTSEYAYTEILI